MFLLNACSSTGGYRQALEMSVDEYKNKITIDEVSSNQLAIISSKNAFPKAPEMTESEKDDNYVRAFVNKSNGEAAFQIVSVIHYEDDNWRFFDQASFLTRDGMNEDKLTLIERKVIECGVFSGCEYMENVGFEIPEELVKKGAERYDPGVVSGLKYVLNSKSGKEYKNIIFSQELIAVLRAVEDYKRIKLRLSKTGFTSY